MVKDVTELKKIILEYLCSSPEIDSAMNKILAMVGKFFDVDRAYIFENSKDDLMCSNTFEWCNEGIEPEIDKLQNLRYLEDIGGEYQENFDENGIFFCKNIEDLPEKQRLLIEPQNIKSMLQCAVLVHGKFKGYIGFDNCVDKEKGWEKSDEATETLVYIAHLICLYLMDYRNRREDEIIEEKKALEKEHEQNLMMSNLLNELPGGIAILKVSDKIECLYFSDGFAFMTGRTREDVEAMFHDEELMKKGVPLENYYDFVKKLQLSNPVGKTFSFTYHLIMASGEVGWLHVSATKIRDDDGAQIYYCVYTNPTDETALYRSVVEDSAIGVFVADRKTRTNYYVNEAGCILCGFESSKIAGKPLKEALIQYGKQPLLTDEQIANLSFDEYSEFHFERKGLYLAVKAKALIWNGVDSYIIYIADETTEHKRQIKLEQTLLKEKTLMSAIPGGTAIYRVKKDGSSVVEYASEGLSTMTGYSREEILNSTDIREFVFKDDLEMATQETDSAIQEGKPINLVYRCVTKDGEVILTRLNAKVMINEDLFDDDLAVLYAVHSQLSEESKLAMQEQQYYRIVLNMTGTAYFEWDEVDGFYASEDFHKYALSVGGVNSVMGSDEWMDAVHPEDISVLRHYVLNSPNLRNAKSAIVRMKMIDGRYQWTEIVSYSQRNIDGKVTKTIGVLRDVDKEWIERNKKLQAALDLAERANKAKTAFISRISHDMRTPLNGILGLTSFLKDSVTDEQGKKDINQLEVSGQYLLNLINDTLDISRIENGRLELHPTICDGKGTFDNIVKLIKPNADAKNQTLFVGTKNMDFTTLYCDIGRVEQIIMNIISNAVKFTDEGGTIEFVVEQIDDTNATTTDRITIKDNGIGMSEEFLPTIFDAFSQSSEAKVNTREGTGLGMAITKQLVDLMGGTISVESELGKGSCFIVEIPFAKATREQILEWKKSVAMESDNSILKDKTVLLCEDHPLNREIAIRLLENKGMHVECADNGKTGVNMFSTSQIEHFDLILMDIQMPVMDGLDATRAIRSLDRTDACEIPIIAMTGNSFDEDVVKTMDAGMNAHLFKPIDSVKMYAVLCEYLNKPHYFHRTKVLVVDDVELNRDVVKAAIIPNYDVLEASDGVEAMEVLKAHNDVDVIITDMMMLNMDGFELIKNIRSNHEYDNIAIIANTLYDEMAKEEEIRNLGADGFVYKPNFPDSIVNELHRVLMSKKIKCKTGVKEALAHKLT